MSRIGKRPIPVPEGVEASVSGRTVDVRGPRGARSFTVGDDVSVALENGSIVVAPRGMSKRARQQWGMSRTMIANCIEGVVTGFRKVLDIAGVGYRAQLNGDTLNLSLGYSHEVNIPVPEGIAVTLPRNTRIILEGNDAQQVGQLAANIRSWREPEPYNGKGIRYADEYIFRKVKKR